jgi:DNA-binding MarR family transcriptional regulator
MRMLGCDTSPKDEDIFNFMVFVYRKMAKPFEDYFKGEFTSLQINALSILCTSGPMTMSELSASLHCPPQQISRMIEKLYEEGHIVRSFDRKDRRKIHISVSDGTAKYIKCGREKFVNSLNTVIKGLDEDDYEDFKDAIHSINRILTKFPQK